VAKNIDEEGNKDAQTYEKLIDIDGFDIIFGWFSLPVTNDRCQLSTRG